MGREKQAKLGEVYPMPGPRSIGDIVWLGDPACHDPASVGGKAAHLSQLAASHPVPAGFCLTAAAYPGRDGLVPASLRDRLAAAYDALAERAREVSPRVAVRSSAIDEDGEAASFAGQHETFLNLLGPDAVIQAVERCWASGMADRAMRYRRQRGLAGTGVRLAVLVQHLVIADTSAVVFTANPVTGSRDEVVITATWGLGESLVGGTVTPDSYVVRKADRAITWQQIGDKRRMTVLTPGGTREVGVPSLLQRQPALHNGQVGELAEVGLGLERSMGWPVDLECAYHGDRLALLQCRPITALRPVPEKVNGRSILIGG